MLKPISHARLAQAVAKLTSETESSTDEIKLPLEMNSKIFIKDTDKCHLVTLESIRYLESCKNYVRVFWGQESAFIKKSLNQVEERLPPRFFFRANRQYIVNLQSIVSIEEAIHDGYDITMDNNFKIEVSRRQAADLKELLSL